MFVKRWCLLIYTCLLYFINNCHAQYGLHVIAEEENSKQVILCDGHLIISNNTLMIRNFSEQESIEPGIHYYGDSDCLFYGENVWAKIVISSCDDSTHGFVRMGGVNYPIENDNCPTENLTYVESSIDDNIRSKRETNDFGTCGVHSDLSNLIKQSDALPMDFQRDHLGNLTLAIALFHDQGLKRRFKHFKGGPDVNLNKYLLAVSKTIRETFQTDVFKSLANIEIVITHVAEVDVASNSFNAGEILHEFNEFQKKESKDNTQWHSALFLTS